MKKILLISDTHGFLEPKLLKHIEYSDEVWHAGDIGSMDLCKSVEALKPFRAVHGNIDDAKIRSHYPENLHFECEGLKILMTHIAGIPGKYPLRVNKLLKENPSGLFICGHSHILKIMYNAEFGLLHVNPGACGVHGFHNVKTAVRFEIEKGEIKNLAVIELGKRTSLT
ncbi:MAG: metallophosphoesterase family protein [Bacteroidia bacterium]|nr:metallophosphoesterase family protein [Bacteroidia bacterium]